MTKPSDLPGDVVKAAELARQMAEAAATAEPAEQGDEGVAVVTNLDDARKQRASARRVEALSLKLAGLDDDTIAERLQITPQGVRDLVNRTLTNAENKVVEQKRALENARLDRVQAGIWSQVLQGDLKAVDTWLRLSQRRAKLNGLDAPMKVDLSVQVRDEMQRALHELEATVLGGVISGEVAEDPNTSD